MSALSEGEYTGALDSNNKYAGPGELKYPTTGIVIKGMFVDGMLHGPATVTMPTGTVFTTTFERGVEGGGSGLVFADNLRYNINAEWPYLQGFDRRFWHEHQAGLPAATETAKVQKRTQKSVE